MSGRNKRNNSTAYHSERVIVLGAGMAGLACARELLHRGYRVLVVEARGRPGGRLKGGTVKVPGSNATDSHPRDGSSRRKQPSRAGEQVMDLGGALIHGVEENPLSSLVQDMGMATQPVRECLLFQNGWPIDPRVDSRISATFNDCLEETFRRCEGPDRGTSFGAVFREVCTERSANASSPVFLWHKANLEVSCGASFEKLGWKWNEDEPYGYDGDHVAVRRSWKAVVDGLAEELDVLYDSPVKRVHVVHPAPQPPELRVPPPAARSKASVLSATNSKRGKTAKRKRLNIDALSSSAPATPPRKSRRLMHLDANARRSSRANLGQMVERFTVASPLSRASAGGRRRAARGSSTALSKREEAVLRPKKQTVVQIELENGRVLEADFVVCTLPLAILQSDMVAFDPPLPSAKQLSIQRLGAGLLNKCVLSFPHVFWQESDFMGLAGENDEDTPYLILNGHAYLNQPVLAFLFGGSDARRIESRTDREIVEDCVDVLKQICGRQVPDPLDYRVTRWGQEQYSRMAFTYIPPGVDGFRELQVMSEAIYDHTGTKPSLMFAGEHTTPYHPSTIHGAFLSGIREACRLDLALYPHANEGMQFSDRELYQRTFTVRRHYADAKRAPVKAQSRETDLQSLPVATKDRKQHRRRGAAGVMKLRKRPNPSKVSAVANGAPLFPPSTNILRKSPRATVPLQKSNCVAGGRKKESLASPPSTTSAIDPLYRQQHVADLEESTLLRGIESFGNDPKYLLELLLPVHGANLNRGDTGTFTLSQVKKRCQQLAPVLRNNSRAASTTAWKRWVAKTVYPSTAASVVENGRRKKKARETVVSSPKRICRTENKKTRQPIVERLIPTPDFKSRCGRIIRKPSLLSTTSGGGILASFGSKEGQSSRKRAKSGSTGSVRAAVIPNVKTRFGRLVKRPDGSQ